MCVLAIVKGYVYTHLNLVEAGCCHSMLLLLLPPLPPLPPALPLLLFSAFIRHGFLGGNHKPSLKSNSEHFTAFIIVQRGLGEGDLGGNSKKKS